MPFRAQTLSVAFVMGSLFAFVLVVGLAVMPPILTTTLVLKDALVAAHGTAHVDGFLAETIAQALIFSVQQAAASATLAVFGGMILGRAMFRHPSKISQAFLAVSRVPFGLPTLVVVFAFVMTYGNQGLVNEMLGRQDEPIPFLYNFWAIVHAHVFFNLGFCTHNVLLAYRTIPQQHWWIASSLNLNRWLTFRTLEWPAIRGSLINHWLLTFTMSITSFAVVLVLGASPALTSLEVLIYQLLRYELNTTGALVAGLVQFLMLVLLAGAVAKVPHGRQITRVAFGQNADNRGPSSLVRAGRLADKIPWALWQIAFLVLLVWAATPLAATLWEGLNSLTKVAQPFVTGTLVPGLLTSLQTALPAALLATASGLMLAQSLIRWYPAVVTLLTIGLLGLSPTILGASWTNLLGFWDLQPYDHALILVVGVQAVLLTPLSLRIFWNALQHQKTGWQTLYQSLDLPLGYQTFIVEARALSPQIRSVFLVSFAFAMGEVAAPAIFGNEHFKPLSLLLLESMGAYRFDEASVLTLTLLVVTQVAFWSSRTGDARA
jgi:thiamine transport system permease protein